jgi:hypothetical protein
MDFVWNVLLDKAISLWQQQRKGLLLRSCGGFRFKIGVQLNLVDAV